MSIVASYIKKEYTPTPEGLQQCVCVDVVDHGMEETQWGPKHKVSLRHQSEHINPENGKRFIINKKYTLSLHEKAILRQHLESWRGKKFTPEELEGFDLEKLIGVNSQIQIVHNVADEGRVWANIQAIVPQGKGTEKLIPLDYVRVQDREESQTPVVDGLKTNDDEDDGLPF